MAEPSIQSTFVLERTYSVSPDRVFRALTDPAIKRRWFAESSGHDVEHFETEASVGGCERARYRLNEKTPLPGMVIEHEARILDLVPEERIVSAATMALQGKCFSATLVTLELTPAGEGTLLLCTHHGAFFEGADGPKMRETGWQKLFDRLGEALTEA